MIAVVDYEMGNLRSVQKAFEVVGHSAIITRDPKEIERASHVVLPGVGAFRDCMVNLERFRLINPIRQAIAKGKPFLGICLGLQVLFTESEEFGSYPGLNIFHGKVKRFRFDSDPSHLRKIPHMGWNRISVNTPSPLLRGFPEDAHVYFVHSFYVEPSDPSLTCTTTDYGISFVSSVWRDNIFGSQFHPEKSQQVGLQLLRNFGTWQ